MIASHVVACTVFQKLIESFGMVCHEVLSCPPAFHHLFGDACQQRQVAANMWLHVLAGDLGPEQQTSNVTGNAKILQPQLSQRIDDDDLSALDDESPSAIASSRG